MRRHEMTMCVVWLKGYFSSNQRRDLPKINYADLTCDCYSYLINESNGM